MPSNLKHFAVHLRRIPGFASKRERDAWFVASVLALSFGMWLAVTWLRFLMDPVAYAINPKSVIQYGWLIGAIGFGGGGFIGLCLWPYRWKNTNTTS